MESEQVIVVTNGKFGGYGYSKEFKDLFKERYGKDTQIGRSGVTIDLIREMGPSKSASAHCKFSFEEIPKEWFPYLRISEHDGQESIYFDRNKRTKQTLDTIHENISHEDLLKVIDQLKRISSEVILISEIKINESGEIERY